MSKINEIEDVCMLSKEDIDKINEILDRIEKRSIQLENENFNLKLKIDELTDHRDSIACPACGGEMNSLSISFEKHDAMSNFFQAWKYAMDRNNEE